MTPLEFDSLIPITLRVSWTPWRVARNGCRYAADLAAGLLPASRARISVVCRPQPHVVAKKTGWKWPARIARDVQIA